MEILGGGPGDEDELRPDRDERPRKADGQGGIGQRRRPVAASLDLGTMDLAPGVPSAYGRPPAPLPTGSPPVVAHAAPAAVPARPGDARTASDEVWKSLSTSTSTRGGSPGTTPGASPGQVAGRAAETGAGSAGSSGEVLDGGPDDEGDSAWHEGAQAAEHAHERDYRADLPAAVLSAPSLALAGISVSLAGLTGGAPVMLLYAQLSSGPPDSGPKLIAKALAAVALLSAVLAFTSLRRMRAATPRWVGTVAGATILIALITLCTAGYFWWTASAIPVDTVSY